MPSRLFSRYLVSVLLDLVAAAAAIAAAYVTVHGYPGVIYRVPDFEEKVLGFLAASTVAFLIFKPYRGSWRYFSIPDLTTVAVASLSAVFIFTMAMFLLARGADLPRSVIVLTFIYMVTALAGMRLGYRIFVEQVGQFPSLSGSETRSQRLVLLCGFSDKAESFIRTARRNRDQGFSIVGILDDSSLNHGRSIQGVRVIGSLDDMGAIVAKLNRKGRKVRELVVTETQPGRKRLAHILERANALSLKVSRLPEPTEVSALTNSLLMEPKPIELEDLLERPEVRPDADGIKQLIEGKVVLATGAGGSIGSELCRQIVTFAPKRLVITDHSEFHLYKLDKELREKHPEVELVTWVVDVRDRMRVMRAFEQSMPGVVFHAAALKHVPMMEDNPLEAIKTNVLGSRNVADAARTVKASTFVMISTDKAVNPTNIMGATKRAAEAYCQALDVIADDTRFKTVRFGNVLGSNGSVVPRFQEQIAAGGPVTVTHPQIVRYFMTIPEAVRLVLQASSHALTRQGERGKIMVLDMGKPVKIVDLAERMIQLAGYKPRIDIDIKFTGLRPGEKLYEELFDPSEVTEGRTEEGYVVASPRIMDRRLIDKSLKEMLSCAEREDALRALELLAHIVPEYRKPAPDRPHGGDTLATVP